MDDDPQTGARVLNRYRLCRIQRAIEYVLLSSIFLFFLLAFAGNYRLPVILVAGLLFFGMNLQLTLLREGRKVSGRTKAAVVADAIESILFVCLLLLFSVPSLTESILGITVREHYALIASMLLGIFLGGLVGEVRFRLVNIFRYSPQGQVEYMKTVRRTILLPFARGL